MEKNKRQENFDDVEKFCSIHKNVINKKKTKTVSFNTATNKDFTPRISNSDGTQYDNVDQFNPFIPGVWKPCSAWGGGLREPPR